jgi:aminopeptidase YwaD
MPHRCRAVLTVVFASVSGCGAEQGSTPRASTPVAPAPPAAVEPAPAPWRVAEATVSEADLRAHVDVLAADDLAGRATFTEGATKAAAYLAARFADYGLAPLPGADAFLVDYVIDEHGWDPERTTLTWRRGKARRALRPGIDFAPLAPTDDHAVEADVVFAGYGLHLPDRGWDDYAGLDVNGKIVLVLRHVPNERALAAEAASAGAGGGVSMGDGAFVAKARAARDRGAIGMIVVTEPSHEYDEELTLVARRQVPRTDARKAARDATTAATAAAVAHGAPSAGARKPSPFVSVMMSRDAADALLAGTRRDLAALQAAVDAGKRPRALRIGKVRAAIAVASTATPRQAIAHNVIGFLAGSDPKLRDQWVVVGGHYDHVGEGGLDGDRIHNGADDNASGTAGVLELAQAFGSLPAAARPARSLVFIGFSGEELGLLGSEAMLAEGDLPVDRVVFMLNLDMIGRNPDTRIQLLGDAFATDVAAVTERAIADLGIEFVWAGTSYLGASDHHSFFTRHVPSMFFFTGTHADYHRPGDHADKLAYDRMAKLTRLAFRVLGTIAEGGVTPRFVHQVLWLGAAIEIADGRARIRAVTAGSRGAAAGLEAGDVVTTIAGAAVTTDDELGGALAKLEPGATAQVELARGQTRVTVEVTRARPGFLGVMPAEVDEGDRATHGLGADEGILLGDVTAGGPADASGLRAGDVLVRLGGEPIGLRQLMQRLSTLGAGETVTAVVIRGGERVEVAVTLGERPAR